jgi:hypothetical protein
MHTRMGVSAKKEPHELQRKEKAKVKPQEWGIGFKPDGNWIAN